MCAFDGQTDSRTDVDIKVQSNEVRCAQKVKNRRPIQFLGRTLIGQQQLGLGVLGLGTLLIDGTILPDLTARFETLTCCKTTYIIQVVRPRE